MRRLLYTLLCIGMAIGLPVRSFALQAAFQAVPTFSCSPVLVNFIDQSTGTPISWKWDFGDGTVNTDTTIANASHTYFGVGTYTVTLVVWDGSTSSSVQHIVIVNPKPTVNFTASDSSVSCAPKTVTFNNTTTLGTPGAGTYSWDFGDGGTSTAANPTYTYTVPGTYNVTLVAVNSGGCTQSFTKSSYITVLAKPHADFTSANNTACNAPASVSFTNASTGSASYQWNFGDGGTSTAASPTHTYTASGTYTVTLIASNGSCTDTITKTGFVNVSSGLNPAFTYSSPACVGHPVTFTITNAFPYVFWDFGDGTTAINLAAPTHVYSAPGNYTVKLYGGNGTCVDSTSTVITVNASPTAGFTATNTISCSTPLTTAFTNTSSGGSYTWDFGDGTTSTQTSPSHTYTSFGTYSVRLIATGNGGCSDTFISPNLVQIVAPTISISASPNAGCLPLTTTFSANITSLIPVSTITWNFGDGNTGTGANPTHTYSALGSYTVTATITTTSGCTATSSPITINVNTKPTANFTAAPTTVCPNTPVTFTNTSTGTVTTYTWLFGNGTTSSQTNPVISYDDPGTYTVTLIANNGGCTDTMVQSNLILVHPPKADFNYTVNCSNRLQVTFTDASIGAQVYSWDFGDGNTATGVTNPVHTYASNNNGVPYIVKLTVTNTTFGCTDTIVKKVRLFPLVAQFSSNDTSICKSGTANFTATSDSNYVSYTWDFGDGSPATTTTTSTTSHVYSTIGSYTVILTVKDIYNCSTTTTLTNYVKIKGPVVSFTNTPAVACAPALITFTNTTTFPQGTSTSSYAWNFGDGTTSTLTSPTHTYPTAGTYTVTLIASDASGCTDTATHIGAVIVNKPTASFTASPTNACLNVPITFTNTSVGTGTLTYNWDFGDGTGSTATSPSHTYAANGTYTIRLIATEGGTCSDTMTQTAYINVSSVVAGFNMSDTAANCPPLTVNFTNVSTGATNYFWNFGNGNVSTSPNPTSVFTTPGVYQVKLKVTNASGCVDSMIKTVTVHGPTGSFSIAPLSGCAPLTITLTATTSNTQYIIWDFDNGTTLTTSNSVSTYTYTLPGNYVPKLIASNGANCDLPIYGVDTVKVGGMTAAISHQPPSLCGSGTIAFTDTVFSTTATITTRSWTFDDGGTSTAHNPSHTYATAGTYIVKLVLTSAVGCKDTVTDTVHILPKPTVSGGGNVSFCAGGSTTLTATGASTYVWSPATGLSCTTCASPVANPTGTTTYTVVGTATNGCTDTNQVIVTVNPLPTISAGSDVSICNGASATLTATGGTTYSWTPATGLSCTNCASPSANPATTTTYTVTGTNTAGCSNTATVTVNVTATPIISGGPNQTICTGSSTTLNASGGVTYSWTPATGLSCTNCASPTANPATTTTYTVTGTAAGGCTGTAQVTVTVTNLPPVSAGPNTAICNGSSTTLNATGATTYSWTPATGLSCTNCASPTANPTTTTTYTVTGVATGGCSNTSTVTITVNPLPTISAGSNQTICSGNSTTLTATGGTSYTWTPATGLSCTNCASPTANPTATTTYTVTGTDANTCSNTAQVTVNVTAPPTISGGPNQTICTGSSTTLNASGGVTYSWTPATGLSCTNCASPTANPATTTTYTVTGTAAGGCTGTAQVTVTVTNLPPVSAGPNAAICNGSSTTLNATGATTYSWTPATGLSCTNCASPTANPTTTTTYTVTGVATGGCSNTSTVTITVNPLPTISAGSNQTICSGNSTTLTATGGTSYTWTPATGLSCTNCASPTANPTTTTTYTVTGTDANTCSNTAQVTVNVNTPPTISAGTNQTICTGASTTLTATGGVSYSWSPATGLSCTNCASPTANPTTTTTYTVTGTGANGCTATSTVTVTVTNLPTVSGGPNAAICNGAATTLNATGATTYSWSPATGLSCTSCASPVANPTSTTTYTVTGTATGGCSNTAQVTVTVNPLPTISAGSNQTICAGGSVTLTATGGTTYSWTPTTGLSCTTCASPVASPTATTTYTVTGTSNGCSNTSTVTVTVNTAPTISAGTGQSICKGNSTTLTATGGVSYSWSPATGLSCTNCASPIASPTTTTTYTVTGTGANGCTATSQVTVTIYTQPIISGGSNQNLCTGSSVTLNATGGSTYVWSPATGLSCTACPSPVATPTNTTTYTVVGTDTHGCVDSGHVTVTVNPLPVVDAGANQTICAGTTTQLQASGASTYSWSPATGLSCTNCANPVASPTTTTTYTVTGTSTAGCHATSTVTVTVNPAPGVTAGAPQTICKGNSAQLNAIGAVTYSWSPATGLSCTTCPDPIATPTTPTVYTVTGTDANGCSATATVAVNFFTPPTISAGADQTLCVGSSAQLQATGGVSYLWTPSNTLSCDNCPNPLATPTTNTTYQVVGTDANGCKDSAKLNISVIQHVPTSVGPGDTLCKGESANLSASGGTSYLWSPSAGLNSTTSATPTATPDVTTTYMVLIQENQCFTDTDYVTVIVNPQPTVDLGPDQAVGAGAGVTLNPKITDATIYQWTPTAYLSCSDCPNPVASPIKTTTYTLVVSNEFGCSDSDAITLSVECDNNQLFIPNTFTPNGDGQNDIFYPHGKGVSTIKRMRIYDRWGELVFDAQNMPVNDPSYGWDGSYKGQRLTPDTYIYIVDATCVTGQPLQIKGDVSLIR
ncbi:PKD domain-containing protein [Taibaiella soli]|nr:PKD domain-containing protein [Taibaiella soli]